MWLAPWALHSHSDPTCGAQQLWGSPSGGRLWEVGAGQKGGVLSTPGDWVPGFPICEVREPGSITSRQLRLCCPRIPRAVDPQVFLARREREAMLEVTITRKCGQN